MAVRAAPPPPARATPSSSGRPPRKPRPARFRARSPRGRLVRLLASFHPYLALSWGAIGLVVLASGPLPAVLTGGWPALARPADWPAVHPLIAPRAPATPLIFLVIAAAVAALVSVGALLAARWLYPAGLREHLADYALQPVGALDADRYVPRYVDAAYVRRRDSEHNDADALARKALRLAAAASTFDSSRLPLGICVFGPPMHGKTRLAWEAMRRELAGWTFMRWPHRIEHPRDLPRRCGRRVVLWLDDLHTYAKPWEAAALNELPRLFAAARVRLVVVATCRAGQDELEARAQLGALMERLTAIWPQDIAVPEAERLEATLAHAADASMIGQFDGRSPGSLLLDVEGMGRVYHNQIGRDGKRVLWALKLLRSAGIYTFPAGRVRAAAIHFKLPATQAAWRASRKEIEEWRFVRAVPLGVARPRRRIVAFLVRLLGRSTGDEYVSVRDDVLVDPVSPVYLDAVVEERSLDYQKLTHAWPQLREHLSDQNDAEALMSLGNAFLIQRHGDLQKNAHEAVLCFRGALRARAGGEPVGKERPSVWATAQCGLGDALLAVAGQLTEQAKREPLGQAVKAYEEALDLSAAQVSPSIRARAKYHRGKALAAHAAALTVPAWAAGEAALRDSAAQAAILLPRAIADYREAAEMYRAASAVAERAVVLTDLASAYLQQARVAAPAGQAGPLRAAAAAYRGALLLYAPQRTPLEWAETERSLGETLRRLAERAPAAEAAALLAEATEAYHAALKVYTPEAARADWAQLQESLGDVMAAQATLMAKAPPDRREKPEKRAKILVEAAAAYTAALRHYTKEQTPIRWITVNHHLSGAECDLADTYAEGGANDAACAALSEARLHNSRALSLLRIADPDHHEALILRDRLARMAVDLACA